MLIRCRTVCALARGNQTSSSNGRRRVRTRPTATFEARRAQVPRAPARALARQRHATMVSTIVRRVERCLSRRHPRFGLDDRREQVADRGDGRRYVLWAVTAETSSKNVAGRRGTRAAARLKDASTARAKRLGFIRNPAELAELAELG